MSFDIPPDCHGPLVRFVFLETPVKEVVFCYTRKPECRAVMPRTAGLRTTENGDAASHRPQRGPHSSPTQASGPWRAFAGAARSPPLGARFHTAILVDPASSICLSQSLSHACISPHGWKSETANMGMGSAICAIMVAKLKLKVFDGCFGAGKGVRPSVPLSAAAYLQLVVPVLSPHSVKRSRDLGARPSSCGYLLSPQWWNHGGRIWLGRRLLTRGDPQAPRRGWRDFPRGQMGVPPVRVESRRQADLVVVALGVEGHLVGCPRPRSRSHAGIAWVVGGGL